MLVYSRFEDLGGNVVLDTKKVFGRRIEDELKRDGEAPAAEKRLLRREIIKPEPEQQDGTIKICIPGSEVLQMLVRVLKRPARIINVIPTSWLDGEPSSSQICYPVSTCPSPVDDGAKGEDEDNTWDHGQKHVQKKIPDLVVLATCGAGISQNSTTSKERTTTYGGREKRQYVEENEPVLVYKIVYDVSFEKLYNCSEMCILDGEEQITDYDSDGERRPGKKTVRCRECADRFRRLFPGGESGSLTSSEGYFHGGEETAFVVSGSGPLEGFAKFARKRYRKLRQHMQAKMREIYLPTRSNNTTTNRGKAKQQRPATATKKNRRRGRKGQSARNGPVEITSRGQDFAPAGRTAARAMPPDQRGDERQGGQGNVIFNMKNDDVEVEGEENARPQQRRGTSRRKVDWQHCRTWGNDGFFEFIYTHYSEPMQANRQIPEGKRSHDDGLLGLDYVEPKNRVDLDMDAMIAEAYSLGRLCPDLNGSLRVHLREQVALDFLNPATTEVTSERVNDEEILRYRNVPAWSVFQVPAVTQSEHEKWHGNQHRMQGPRHDDSHWIESEIPYLVPLERGGRATSTEEIEIAGKSAEDGFASGIGSQRRYHIFHPTSAENSRVAHRSASSSSTLSSSPLTTLSLLRELRMQKSEREESATAGNIKSCGNKKEKEMRTMLKKLRNPAVDFYEVLPCTCCQPRSPGTVIEETRKQHREEKGPLTSLDLLVRDAVKFGLEGEGSFTKHHFTGTENENKDKQENTQNIDTLFINGKAWHPDEDDRQQEQAAGGNQDEEAPLDDEADAVRVTKPAYWWTDWVEFRGGGCMSATWNLRYLAVLSLVGAHSLEDVDIRDDFLLAAGRSSDVVEEKEGVEGEHHDPVVDVLGLVDPHDFLGDAHSSVASVLGSSDEEQDEEDVKEVRELHRAISELFRVIESAFAQFLVKPLLARARDPPVSERMDVQGRSYSTTHTDTFLEGGLHEVDRPNYGVGGGWRPAVSRNTRRRKDDFVHSFEPWMRPTGRLYDEKQDDPWWLRKGLSEVMADNCNFELPDSMFIVAPELAGEGCEQDYDRKVFKHEDEHEDIPSALSIKMNSRGRKWLYGVASPLREDFPDTRLVDEQSTKEITGLEDDRILVGRWDYASNKVTSRPWTHLIDFSMGENKADTSQLNGIMEKVDFVYRRRQCWARNSTFWNGTSEALAGGTQTWLAVQRAVNARMSVYDEKERMDRRLQHDVHYLQKMICLMYKVRKCWECRLQLMWEKERERASNSSCTTKKKRKIERRTGSNKAGCQNEPPTWKIRSDLETFLRYECGFQRRGESTAQLTREMNMIEKWLFTSSPSVENERGVEGLAQYVKATPRASLASSLASFSRGKRSIYPPRMS
ncbi:unnamed protein product [Amoebophrya sp. A25]|nr:unnamed protein product [Amoebophrya sp. A25]|eukprot:GSA25T00002633001.1